MGLAGWGSDSGASEGVLTNFATTSSSNTAVVDGGLAASFRSASVPTSTRAAYAGDWAKFTAWCTREGHVPLPAEAKVVGEYLAQAAALVNDRGGFVYAPATLARWLAGINAVHRGAGHAPPGADPGAAAVLRGIRATRKAPPRRAKPFRLEHLTTVLEVMETRSWPGAVIGRRDAALLLVGFAGALRRSELAALQLRDVEITADGELVVRIRSSKTDQDAAGATIAYPRGSSPVTCPACRLLDWAAVLGSFVEEGRVGVLRCLHQDRPRGRGRGHSCSQPARRHAWDRLVATDPEGAVFRSVTKATTINDRPVSGATVHAVLVRRLAAAGVDPAGYSGHSLRAGFVTDAYTAGASAHEIMRQTRHTSPATLEGYARHYTPLEANAVTRIGL